MIRTQISTFLEIVKEDNTDKISIEEDPELSEEIENRGDSIHTSERSNGFIANMIKQDIPIFSLSKCKFVQKHQVKSQE